MVPLEWRLALAPLPLGARPQTSVKARDGGRTAFHNRVGEWSLAWLSPLSLGGHQPHSALEAGPGAQRLWASCKNGQYPPSCEPLLLPYQPQLQRLIQESSESSFSTTERLLLPDSTRPEQTSASLSPPQIPQYLVMFYKPPSPH